MVIFTTLSGVLLPRREGSVPKVPTEQVGDVAMKTGDSNRAFWDPEIQTMPLESLRILQSDRLRDAVQRVYEGSEFFRQRFDKAGISPDDIKSVDDIVKIPPFKKSDLRENEAVHP